jgi:hypothetical protein
MRHDIVEPSFKLRCLMRQRLAREGIDLSLGIFEFKHGKGAFARFIDKDLLHAQAASGIPGRV